MRCLRDRLQLWLLLFSEFKQISFYSPWNKNKNMLKVNKEGTKSKNAFKIQWNVWNGYDVHSGNYDVDFQQIYKSYTNQLFLVINVALFYFTIPFLYPLKTSEKWSVEWNELTKSCMKPDAAVHRFFMEQLFWNISQIRSSRSQYSSK